MKKNIDIGFVILHYKTDDQTKNCIESIISNLKLVNYVITIIDNFSNNGSIERIEKEYKLNNKIKILKSNENIGFARGNNLGITWINKNYSTKFIVVLNNDTKILDNNFYSLIEDEYHNSGFAVMGPKIILLNNVINPLCKQDISLDGAKKFKKHLIKQLVIKLFYIEKIVKLLKRKQIHKENLNPELYYKDIILHGCFLIFSKSFFEKYSGFDDRTFLYREEELLFLRLKKANLISVYNPKIVVFHEEDASTNYSMPNERKRAIYKIKNMYKSNNILINELKEMERNK